GRVSRAPRSGRAVTHAAQRERGRPRARGDRRERLARRRARSSHRGKGHDAAGNVPVATKYRLRLRDSDQEVEVAPSEDGQFVVTVGDRTALVSLVRINDS